MVYETYKIIKRLYISAIVILFQQAGFAQQSIKLPKQEQIHQVIRYFEVNRHFNGNILIAEDGKVIYENAIGWANIEDGEALTLTTPFYLASLAKTFTATGIMKLKEEGKLDYDDKIATWFSEMGSAGNKISIRHLLNHTSGLPDYFSMGWDETGLTNAQLYDKLVHNTPMLNSRPGYKYSYNNTGYVLLALIIEKVSGLPFYKFIESTICEPLGMEDTWVYDIRNPEISEKDRAIGYRKNMKHRDDYLLLTTGDGGMYSTIEDMFTWDRALHDNKILSQATLEEAYLPVTLPNGVTKNYGFGWVIGSNLNGKIVTHSGGLAGFRNYFERQIDVGNTLIILTNNSNNDIVEIRNILVKILDGRPYEMPEN